MGFWGRKDSEQQRSKKKNKQLFIRIAASTKLFMRQFLNLRDVEINLISLGSMNNAIRFIVLLAN
jgi:hypothetical protein